MDIEQFKTKLAGGSIEVKIASNILGEIKKFYGFNNTQKVDKYFDALYKHYNYLCELPFIDGDPFIDKQFEEHKLLFKKFVVYCFKLVIDNNDIDLIFLVKTFCEGLKGVKND
jgi:hypothetical protein